jgi:hypothetical protein
MMRCVASAMHVRFRDAGDAVAGMASHMRDLVDALGLPQVRTELRKLSGINKCDGLLSFYLCETAKLLKETGVLQELCYYKGNPRVLIDDLTDDAAEDFMHHLEEFGQVPVPPGAETTAQIAVMPDEFNIHHHLHPMHVTTNTLQRWKVVTNGASS